MSYYIICDLNVIQWNRTLQSNQEQGIHINISQLMEHPSTKASKKHFKTGNGKSSTSRSRDDPSHRGGACACTTAHLTVCCTALIGGDKMHQMYPQHKQNKVLFSTCFCLYFHHIYHDQTLNIDAKHTSLCCPLFRATVILKVWTFTNYSLNSNIIHLFEWCSSYCNWVQLCLSNLWS